MNKIMINRLPRVTPHLPSSFKKNYKRRECYVNDRIIPLSRYLLPEPDS